MIASDLPIFKKRLVDWLKTLIFIGNLLSIWNYLFEIHLWKGGWMIINWTKPKIKISNLQIFKGRNFLENFIKNWISKFKIRIRYSCFLAIFESFWAKIYIHHRLRKRLPAKFKKRVTTAVSWKAIKWLLPFDIRLIFDLGQWESSISRSQRSGLETHFWW